MAVLLNENYRRLANNYLFSETARRTREYEAAHPENKVIRLGIGDVTLPLSKTVIAAMEKAAAEMGVKETFRGYPPEYGYDFTREAIASYYARRGVTLDPGDIFVSDGAKSDTGNIAELFGATPALIPDPVYPVYMDSSIMQGRETVLVPGSAENGFLPAPPAEKRSYIIYLCSPNNPTGATYSHEGLRAWVEYAKETGSVIVFDSAYEAFVSDGSPRSIFEVEGAKECAVEIGSFSKSAGFTGTRCSWSVFPKELMVGDVHLRDMWARRQATKFNGVPYVIQRAAEAALTEQGLIESRALIEYYMENARVLSAVFEKKGIYFTGGINSPYLWIKCPNGEDSWEFFDALLRDVQIVGTPGSGFGKAGEGFFRFTSFGSHEATLEAAAKLEKYL